MKETSFRETICSEKIMQKKPILYAILAAGSFLGMLWLCVRMKGDGVALLLCLIVHTCSLLLLYRDALIALDPEDWKTEEDWMQEDLPPEEAEDAPAEVPVPYNKTIYTELRQSLMEAPVIAFPAEESPEDTAEEIPEELPENAAEITTEPEIEATEDTPEIVAESEKSEEAPAETASESETDAAEETPEDALRTLFVAPKKLVEMDLIAAAQDAINSLTRFADAQKIKLQLSAPCETLLMQADPESIRILFRNIIDNSIKYMGRPGHMMITISLLGDDIFLILKDTGKGLAEEETRHIFELNFQGSNRVSGNGLGLTQTKMIVERFGGTIYAKSSPGNGMAIYIQLPVRPAS